jgi:hypothetical protein
MYKDRSAAASAQIEAERRFWSIEWLDPLRVVGEDDLPVGHVFDDLQSAVCIEVCRSIWVNGSDDLGKACEATRQNLCNPEFQAALNSAKWDYAVGEAGILGSVRVSHARIGP